MAKSTRITVVLVPLAIGYDPASYLGGLAVVIQQHRLADAPQAGYQDVVCRLGLLEELAKSIYLLIAITQIRRLEPHSWAIGTPRRARCAGWRRHHLGYAK